MFSFDGTHATKFFDKVLDVKRGMSAPRSPKLQTIPGKTGAYFFGIEKDVLEFEVTAVVKGMDRQELWQKIRKINGWLLKDDLKKLVLDDEPNLYYQAICIDKLDLDEIIETGIAKFKLLIPDSFAYGETKQQRVGSASGQFIRHGIRYREDGSEVTENYPIYHTGKFGEAILIEEGTTNLLNSAADPVQEEVSVDIGQDYYLSTVGGSATIEHKREETLPKTQLDKEGIDFNGEVDSAWNLGIHKGTEAVSDGANPYGILQLSKSGSDLSYTENSFEQWSNGAFEGTSVLTVDENTDVIVLDLPFWNLKSDCSDLYPWDGEATKGASVISDGSGYNYFIRVTSSTTDTTGLERRPNIDFSTGFTLDFRARTNGTSSFYISNGVVAFKDAIPNTNNQWSWFRVLIKDSSTGTLYQDGNLIKTLTPVSYSLERILLAYNSSGIAGVITDIDAVYFAETDLGPPPTNHTYIGDFFSGEIDVSQVSLLATKHWVSQFVINSIFSGIQGEVSTKFQTGTFDGEKTNWSEIWETEIPFVKGEDLTDKRLKYWVHMEMQDSGDSPWFIYNTINLTSGYNMTGSRESEPIDISQVGKAGSTLLEWANYDLPTGTAISLETQISTNGGTTWTSYQNSENGYPVPNVDQEMELSNSKFRYKFILTTSDVEITPKLDWFKYHFKTGYKPVQTFELPGYYVDSIGMAENSVLEWLEDSQSGTNITFESSLDGANWTIIENGGPFIESGTDLTGKMVYIRYTLSTEDTIKTPTIQPTMIWYIQQQEQNRIKPATNTIRLTPQEVSRWQLEQKPYRTGWHTTGTREPEILRIFIQNLNKTFKTANFEVSTTSGSIDFYLWEKEENFERYILDTDGTYRLQVFRNQNNQYEIWYNGNQEIVFPSPSIGWHHLGITWENMRLDVYLDGELIESKELPINLDLIGTVYIYIGCSKDGDKQWNSLIDDLVIHETFKDQNYFAERAVSEIPGEITMDSIVYPFDGSLASLGDTNITYLGTAEAYPIFTITFATNIENFRISNGEEYVQVTENFKPNDVLVIDCEKQVTRLNDRMIGVDLDSDYFSIKNGDVIQVDPGGVATVDVSFVERWL